MLLGLKVPDAVSSKTNGAISSETLCLPSWGSFPLLLRLEICFCLTPKCEPLGYLMIP